MSNEVELKVGHDDGDKESNSDGDDFSERGERNVVKFSDSFIEHNREMLLKLKMQQEREDMINELHVHLFKTPTLPVGRQSNPLTN